MNDTTQIPVPPTVALAEALAMVDFLRERSLLNAVMRDKAEQKVRDLEKQIEEQQNKTKVEATQYPKERGK